MAMNLEVVGNTVRLSEVGSSRLQTIDQMAAEKGIFIDRENEGEAENAGPPHV